MSTSGIDLDWLARNFPQLRNLTPLKAGGQKQVFSAEHEADGPVVLKIIRPEQSLEMTRREIMAASSLMNQRVPQILEVDVIETPLGDCVWFREKRVEGETIRALLSKGAFDKKQLLRLALQVLEILVEAEKSRIVHRDIKPDNLIRDLNGDTWLIDFGVARHLNMDSLTATAAFYGKFTLGYAPPEQFHNKKLDIDIRCDLFALGVTLYECATGVNPYLSGARDHVEVLRRVQGPPLPLLTLDFSSATDFADLISAMTQPRRDHRPRTAEEAYDWVKQICEREGV